MKRQFKVLNCRPQPRAAQLSKQLRAYNIDVVEYCPIEIEAINGLMHNPYAKQLAYKLDEFSDIIVTSGFAADIGLDFLADFWPQWPENRWWAIGTTTQQRMRAFAIEAQVAKSPKGENSEALWQALSYQVNHKDLEQVLILTGRHGRGYLQAKLTEHRRPFSSLEVYQRKPSEDKYPIARYNAIILTSVEIALYLFKHAQVLTQFMQDCYFLCASERICKVVRSKGATKVINCGSANSNTVSKHVMRLLP